MRAAVRPAAKKKAPRTRRSAVLRALDAYLDGIASGRVLVAEVTRLSVLRHLNDLERSKTDPAYPYFFDEKRVEPAVRFAGLFTHVKGDIAGQPIDLADCEWGLFFTAAVHGWRVKKTGTRRFRKALAWLPRGNNKSTILSVNSLYAAFGDGGQADVYSLATTKEQAGICWGDAAQMLRANPGMKDALGVEVYQTAVVQPTTNSIFKRLASRDTTLDGLNVSWANLDELHEVTRALWTVIETALGKRANSLLAAISTAGMNAASFGREMYRYCRQILEGEVNDELTFVLIYECPEGMDPYSEEAQRAANPMWGKSVRPEILRAAAAKARVTVGARTGYLVKHMNVWCTAAECAFDMRKYDQGADPSLTVEQLRGDPCVMGLDLASRNAFADVVKLFWRNRPHRDPARAHFGETERHYYVFATHYINAAAVEESTNDMYRAWAAASPPAIVVTPGNRTDYGFIRNQILDDLEHFGIREVATDPYESAQLAQSFGDASVPLVEVPQRVQYLSVPLKEMISAIIEGRWHHDGDEVLRWMAGNTEAREDAQENLFPQKSGGRQSTNYIDGISATLNALSRALGIGEEAERSTQSYLADGDMVIA